MQNLNNRQGLESAVAETLESRRLFAVTIYPGTYSLTLTGTSGADSIVASKSGSNLKLVLDGTTTKTYPLTSVRSLFVYLKEGNDKFVADNALTQYMQVDGNFGKDTITTGSGNDSIFSGNDDDQVSGGDGNDTIDGGTGNDTINGNGGNDSLLDGAGSDKVYGGSGNDLLDPGVITEGSDLYDGGDGVDRLSYAARLTGVVITTDGIANDGKKPSTGYSSSEKDNVSASIEEFNATKYADRIKLSGVVNNEIFGTGGTDDIDAGPGNDLVDVAYTSSVTVVGGTGNDWIVSGSANDLLSGGDGNDTVFGGDGADHIYAGSGNDSVSGSFGGDLIYGEAGNDTLNGGGEGDILSGDSGNDLLNGDDGNDTLRGGNDNDTLVGGAGIDRMYGESGNDQLIAKDGIYSELVDGGTGTDTAVIDRLSPPLNTPLDTLISIESST